MDELLKIIVEFYSYISIPFIGGVLGWMIVKISVKYTISSSKGTSDKHNAIVALTVDKLMILEKIFPKFDSDEAAEIINPEIEKLSIKIINELLVSQSQAKWDKMPKAYKQKILEKVKEESLKISLQLISDIKENINELINLKVFLSIGVKDDEKFISKMSSYYLKRESKLIVCVGFFSGFLFGIFQMIISFYFKPWWMIVISSSLITLFSYRLAFSLIYNPGKVINYLGKNIQDVFAKRQSSISGKYAHVITSEILTTKNIFEYIFSSSHSNKLTEIIYKHVGEMIESMVISLKKLKELFGGDVQIRIIKNIAVSKYKQNLPFAIAGMYPYIEKTLNLKKQIQSRMSALSAHDFENLMRLIFPENKLKLAIISLLLGGFIGAVQRFLFFY